MTVNTFTVMGIQAGNGSGIVMTCITAKRGRGHIMGKGRQSCGGVVTAPGRVMAPGTSSRLDVGGGLGKWPGLQSTVISAGMAESTAVAAIIVNLAVRIIGRGLGIAGLGSPGGRRPVAGIASANGGSNPTTGMVNSRNGGMHRGPGQGMADNAVATGGLTSRGAGEGPGRNRMAGRATVGYIIMNISNSGQIRRGPRNRVPGIGAGNRLAVADQTRGGGGYCG